MPEIKKKTKKNGKKGAAKAYYSSIKGYKGKGGGMNKKSKSFKEKQFDKNRADARDAARRSEERRVGKECRSRWWPEH